MAALSYCTDLVREFDRDRFLTAQFAPVSRRNHLMALYAFNVEVARIREMVKEPILGQVRLQWWRETIDLLYAGRQRHHDVADALGVVIAEANLSRSMFDDLIDAREFDLEGRPPATMAELKRYAERTSANLTLLALEVLGYRRDAPVLAGRHVGLAWALTGLLRAVPFHARQSRLYFPWDMLEQAGLVQEDVFEGRARFALSVIAAMIGNEATGHLRHAREQRDIPRGALAALLPGVLATHYLDRMARVGYDVFDSALVRDHPGRLIKLWWNAWRGRF